MYQSKVRHRTDNRSLKRGNLLEIIMPIYGGIYCG